jgi:hypothetical protein
MIVKIEGNFKDYKYFKECINTKGVVIPENAEPPGAATGVAERAGKKHRPREDEDLEGLSERELKKQRLKRELRLLEDAPMEMDEADEAEVDPMEAVLAGVEADEAEVDPMEAVLAGVEANEAEVDPMEAVLAGVESAELKPVGPTWLQCVLEGKNRQLGLRTRWQKAGSRLGKKLEYMAWTQPRNAGTGELTGFVVVIARAKTPMPLEEWQALFCCREASGVEDTRDLGAEVDELRKSGQVWCEEGKRARTLEDGQLRHETRREWHKRMMAEGTRQMREVAAEKERYYAEKRAVEKVDHLLKMTAEAEARARAHEQEMKEMKRMNGLKVQQKEQQERRAQASAAAAARAMLAVRAAWGGKC